MATQKELLDAANTINARLAKAKVLIKKHEKSKAQKSRAVEVKATKSEARKNGILT